METKCLCFTNNKGGSGKSTSCANLGYELACLGKRVLLIDGDMQMNLTLSFFEEEKVLAMAESGHTLYEGLKGKKDLTPFIEKTVYEGVDLIPSSTLMSQIEYELFPMMRREYVLRNCLSKIRQSGNYDYILIDAPPTLGTWVVNILCSADEVIIPVEASPWGLFGLANMFEFLYSLSEVTEAKVMGILITKVDERKNYFKETKRILSGYDSIRVFDTVIHVDSAVEWSQDASRPVGVYKKSTRSAREFRQLAQEVADYAGR